tara:strand:+ start:20055 stop:20450 length:396 start_codon:yes stop_codon:yes gene_type:complete
MNLTKLIIKGLIIVYGPLVSFVIICGFIANWFAMNILKSEKVDFIVMITVFIAVFIGWFWWSYKIVKWKYFAFSKLTLNESHKLYSKAIGAGLIWPTGSFFNKTEIWTKKDKNNWLKIDPEIRKIFETDRK